MISNMATVNYDKQRMRFLMFADQPGFYLQDICRILCHPNAGQALAKVGSNQKIFYPARSDNGVWLVTISGMCDILWDGRRRRWRIIHFSRWIKRRLPIIIGKLDIPLESYVDRAFHVQIPDIIPILPYQHPREHEPHALYRFFDKNKALLYVGISWTVAARIAGHRNTKSWWYNIVTVEIEWFTTRTEVLAAETAVIIAEKPKHNKVHSPR